MAKTVNRLTDRKVKSLKDPGLHADGNGLYLRVDAGGAKRWTLIFQWRGARKEMGLGGYQTVSLSDAREAALAARKLVQEGVNPIEARKVSAASDNVKTFGCVADDLVDDLKAGWRNPKHAAQWTMTLRDYVTFRDKPVELVDTEDVLASLKPLWHTVPDTANRLRGRIERVLDAAKAKGLRSGENPARWRGHLMHLLPAPKKLERGHHAALAYGDAPAFYQRVKARPALAAQALQLTMLTACRSGEALNATWGEIDLEVGVWTIPAARMKAGQEHRVPLADAATALLKSLRPEQPASADWIFPGVKDGRPLSNMAMEMLLRRLERRDITVHGFRSTFSDWAHDTTAFASETIEQSLAHVVGSAVLRAYRRGNAFDKRRELMVAWADYLASASN